MATDQWREMTCNPYWFRRQLQSQGAWMWYHYLIVGAGFASAVLAERLSFQLRRTCLKSARYFTKNSPTLYPPTTTARTCDLFLSGYLRSSCQGAKAEAEKFLNAQKDFATPWHGRTRNNGMNSDRRAELTKSLITLLSEVQTDQADVADIYFCYRLLLLRKADPEGWNHWRKRANSKMSTSQLAGSFLGSGEFKHRWKLRKATRVSLKDYALYLDPDDVDVTRGIAEGQIYEPHVTKVLKRELKPDYVFVDVGCNIGWFLLLAASMLSSGKVIGVEPNPRNLQILFHSIAENGFSNVTVLPYAATDQQKLLQLSGHAAYGYVHSVDGSDAEYVNGMPLDELVGREPKIDVVKIDIEGHEPIAFRGMRGLIKTHRPVIFSEFHPRLIKDFSRLQPQDYLHDMAALGYRLMVIDFQGNEIAFDKTEQIMDYWRIQNEKYGSGDTMHLDLIARPT